MGKRRSRSSRADLIFPVGRMQRVLLRGGYTERVGSVAPVYLAAVLQFLVADLLDLAGNSARKNREKSIRPLHVFNAVQNAELLNNLTTGIRITGVSRPRKTSKRLEQEAPAKTLEPKS